MLPPKHDLRTEPQEQTPEHVADAPEKALVPLRTSALILPTDKAQRVVSQFFSRRSAYTIEGYRQDLQRFAEYLELVRRGDSREERERGIAEATRHLFALTAVDANYTVMQYVTWMGDAKAAPATINRRLSALRSLVKLGQMLGAVTWSLGVRGVKAQKMRDVRGPTVEQVRQMLGAARAQPPARAARDVAMVTMFFTMGLRGVEMRELRLEHVDFDRGRIAVRGKGRTERSPQTFTGHVDEALREWLKYRGDAPGPLFLAIGRRKSTAAGLTRTSVWKIVKQLGAKMGIKAWPHGLRHSAITESLELLDGDVRAVRHFSRHERVQTVMDYDDARRDVAGSIAEKLAQRLLAAPTLPDKRDERMTEPSITQQPPPMDELKIPTQEPGAPNEAPDTKVPSPKTLTPAPAQPPPAGVTRITSRAEFDRAVVAAPGPVAVLFVQEGCDYCDADKKALEGLAQSCPEALTALEVDTSSNDDLDELADEWGVDGTPTLMFAKKASRMTPDDAEEVGVQQLRRRLKCARTPRK